MDVHIGGKKTHERYLLMGQRVEVGSFILPQPFDCFGLSEIFLSNSGFQQLLTAFLIQFSMLCMPLKPFSLKFQVVPLGGALSVDLSRNIRFHCGFFKVRSLTGKSCVYSSVNSLLE